ncbi:hypothetical protein DPEC_G00322630 [Dallia pectoralis]|uniref:Uncharacterized protein n=1 Tax=Dallia pectoralis TaxID=75939 RepID=A0ACC2FAF9_DALPE|nr:hypothetical protein DPEC_G00322630 [Dallia pectoralis]
MYAKKRFSTRCYRPATSTRFHAQRQRPLGNSPRRATAQGFIRPSPPAQSSIFFFVKKNDDGLRPCIDPRAPDKVRVKHRCLFLLYPALLNCFMELASLPT